MNIGLFLPNWVGDLVMATPALRALRDHFADARLIGVLRPQLIDVLAGTQFVDRYVPYEPKSGERELGNLAVLRQLRQLRLDQVVLFTNSLRTALLARASGAPRRIGYVRDGRRWLLTDRLYHRRAQSRWVPTPVLDDYLRLAAAAGAAARSKRIELATLPQDDDSAGIVLRRLGLRTPLVTLNCSGAFGAAKLWPVEYFAQLARRIAQRQGMHVLALCGPSERDMARRIAAEADHPRVASLADEQLGIGLTKACVRRSRLLVTTDSGPRHFAAAFDVPVITLFGPTHIAWSETYSPRAVHLQKQVACGPCQQRVCPLGHHRCMRELTVDEVYQAVQQQLEAQCSPQAA